MSRNHSEQSQSLLLDNKTLPVCKAATNHPVLYSIGNFYAVLRTRKPGIYLLSLSVRETKLQLEGSLRPPLTDI